ncbi:MAG: PQQ-like beta-propeller repeat protein [Deltaproteobacteria bacterium]|jgi:outer membrane protein assembly factor BamB|nr:PQQ-like beta-propeller repeat protein [Deltaproteobacteria bacterium]MBT6434783.1 PQQ-like beta-propeller repeat protein [Deltaproteobacteria bacterium]MBT6490436.1 PQQ-like beta-propeller repeat protein [Deltaproteobacteria bacterium]
MQKYQYNHASLSLRFVVLSTAATIGMSGCNDQAPGTPPGYCAATLSCDSIESNASLTYPPLLDTEWTITGEFQTYSSPRAADLNGDCIKDIIIGHGEEGGPETGQGVGYVTAHDGASGALLWRVGPDFDDAVSLYEIVGSPALIDLNQDETDDVVIGGRDGALIAVDGITGDKLWQFYPEGDAEEDGWYNFYTPQPIGDVNADGVPDILSANGGDAKQAPFQERLPGFLMVISGSDGSILYFAQMPDGMETYMSPIVYTPQSGGVTYVLFGTGGESFAGSLWRVPLDDVLTGDISAAQKLTEPRSHKGVIAPPSLADVNLDGSEDIIVVTFDGQVEAIDGITGESIWHYELSGANKDEVESYATPAIGYFDGDGAPDVFVTLSLGVWPRYSGSALIALSGWNGDVISREYTDYPGFPSPLAADLNGDSRDEALVVIPNFMESRSTFQIIDFANDENYTYEWDNTGAGTPLIEDLDNDGVLELIGCYAAMNQMPAEWTLFRKSLNASTQGVPSWGGYLGSATDGSFRRQCNQPATSLP